MHGDKFSDVLITLVFLFIVKLWSSTLGKVVLFVVSMALLGAVGMFCNWIIRVGLSYVN